MKSKSGAPKPGAKGFCISVLPKQEKLDQAIMAGGHCSPTDCWHFLEISSILHQWDPEGKHHVRIDAGKIKFNLWGWRYVADTPLHVKRSLILFDHERYDDIRIREYNLRCHRTTRIKPLTQERKDQINAARLKRFAEGRPDKRYPSIRDRVIGFSGIV